jgi:drug/metabolite transporter (DMT)-like permease
MKLWKYSILVFLGGCSYGVVSTFVKLAYRQGFVVSEVTGVQYFCGAMLLWLLACFVPRINMTVKQSGTLLVSGMPMGLTGIFYNNALGYINASFAIILLLQFTWINVVLKYMIDREVPDRKNIIAITVILLGSSLAAGVLETGIAFSWAGIVWGLLAAVSFAVFIYVSGRSGGFIHPVYKSAMMTSGAALLVFVLMPPVFLFNGALANGLLHYGLLTGLFGSLIPPVLFNAGMPRVGGLGNILSASELPMAVLMSALVLHETVGFLQWIGVLVILSGIAYPHVNRS